MIDQIHVGDAWTLAKALPDNSVHCIVTSPPYFGLRSYLPDGHDDKAAEFGLEATPQAFVSKLVELFRELRRALRDDGVLWLNLGDSYYNYRPGVQARIGPMTQLSKPHQEIEGVGKRNNIIPGLKEKDLCGIPWRCAFALQDDGWYLRSAITWCKPSAMPESVLDRPTKATEQIFLLAKSQKYYYDNEAVRTPSGANLRDYWIVNTTPYDGAHFATFPAALITPMILAGTSAAGACPACLAPYARRVERESKQAQAAWSGAGRENGCMVGGGHFGRTGQWSAETVTTGWSATCRCEAGPPVPCVVLDPFFGSGTTGFVCVELGRRYIGFELNADYCELARRRISRAQLPLLAGV